MKLSFEGKETVLLMDLIKTQDERNIPIKLYARKTDPTKAEADIFEIEIDGVKWLSTGNATHGVILYSMLRDHVNEFMHYVTTGQNYYYLFDCLDGVIGAQYYTPAEINKLIYGNEEPLPENKIIQVAKDYEATLYRYAKDENGNYTAETMLYDAEL